MIATSRPAAVFEVAKELKVSPKFARKLVLDSSNEWLTANAFAASPERFASALEDELSYFIDNGLIPTVEFA